MASPFNNTTTQVIQINSAQQLPLKLTSSNYSSWLLQIKTLLIGLDLIDYVDKSICVHLQPSPMKRKQVVSNHEYTIWQWQDKLIIHAILSSLSNLIILMIARSAFAREAMTTLIKTFSSKTRSRVITFKRKFTTATQETKKVDEYLQMIEAIVDELALV